MRIDLFDIEVESIRFFSTFTQRSLGETEAIEIAPAAELAPEHRELAEIAALEDAEDRPDVAELLPVDRFQAFLDLAADAAILIAAEEDVAPGARRPLAGRVRRLPRRRRPPPLRQARRHRRRARRARERPPELDLRRPADRVPRPGRRPRRALAQGGRARAREARALGLPHRRHVVAPRRRRARRLQPRAPARLLGRRRRPAVLARHAARRLHRRRPAPRGHPRAPALPPPPRRASGAADAPARRAALVRRPAHGRHHRPRGPRHRPLRRASTRRPSPASRATTSSSSTPAPTASSCPVDQLAKITRYVGAGGTPPAAEQARRQGVGGDEGARPARGPGARGRAAQPLRRAPPPAGARLPRGRRVAARVRGALPLPGDRRPARGDRARQGRHGARAADGPPDLRRRRLRQDRGRAARRVQGRRRRQAGARAGADDDPRPAALRHLLRAPEGLPVHHRARQPLPLGQGAEGRDRRLQRRPASTSSSAPTACSGATCAARTSG